MVNIWTILLSLLIFGLLIVVHEAGHFISARLCRVGVTEFAIGMGPVLYKRQGKHTLFSVRALPIGGFCKIVDEDDEDGGGESISSKGKLARAFIFSAGSLMNFVAAYVLFAIALLIVGLPTTTVGGFTQGYPAEQVGLAVGDRVVSIANSKIDRWEDISVALKDYKGEGVVEVVVFRAATNENLTFQIQPGYVEGEDRYIIGITPQMSKNIFGVLKKTAILIGTYTALIFSTLIGLLKGAAGLDVFTGPIGVVSIVGQMAAYGVLPILQIAASISLSLAILNMLPIPALDGSRIFLLLVEWIKGSPVNRERENIFHLVGFALMILLAVVVAFNDVYRFF